MQWNILLNQFEKLIYVQGATVVLIGRIANEVDIIGCDSHK